MTTDQDCLLSSQDTVHTPWTDADMKEWLVEHGIIKSDAQIQREKLQKLMVDNYSNAKDTVWSSWRDSDMRDWLIEHGYLKSDAQKTRDELIGMMHDKYACPPNFLIRFDVYFCYVDSMTILRELRHTSSGLMLVLEPICANTACRRMHSQHLVRVFSVRSILLPVDFYLTLGTEEVRIRWVQTQHRAEGLYARIKNIILSGVETAEEKLGMVSNIHPGCCRLILTS